MFDTYTVMTVERIPLLPSTVNIGRVESLLGYTLRHRPAAEVCGESMLRQLIESSELGFDNYCVYWILRS